MSKLPVRVVEIQTELAKVAADLKVLQLRESALCKKQDALKEELRANCTHPSEHVKTRKEYYDGSYYDRASTESWAECTICGARSEKKVETHPWYG